MAKSNDSLKQFGEMVKFKDDEKIGFPINFECKEERGLIDNIFFPKPPAHVLSNMKPAIIYIEALKALLNNKEFCESDIWVKYIKEQVELLELLLDEVAYNPFEADRFIKDHNIQEDQQKRRKSGGDAAAKSYRDVEPQIIERAKGLIKHSHDGRPADRYRLSSLAEAIKYQNKTIEKSKWIKVPEISTVKRYLKKAVERGELPLFLTLGRPKKW